MECYKKTGLGLYGKPSDVEECKRKDTVGSSGPSTSSLRVEKSQLFQPQMNLSYHHHQRQEYVTFTHTPPYIPPQLRQISPSERPTYMITSPSDSEATLRHDALLDQRNLDRRPTQPSVPISIPLPFAPEPQVNIVARPLIMPQIVFPNGYLSNSSDESFNDFQNRMTENMRKSNVGPKVRKTNSTSSAPTSTVEEKTQAYLEKRKKNNAAAKKSRDNKRTRVEEMAIREAYLEKEYNRLQHERNIWRNELARLQCIIRDH